MGFRLDRAATLYLANPLRHLGKKPSVPILMYHSIADEDESGVQPYYRTATSPQAFAEQMSFLRQAGYQTIGLAEAWNRLSSDDTVVKTVVITFDDGFRNFHTNAFPILSRYGFTATMFLPSAFIGTTPRSFKGRECLTWGEIREMQTRNMCFGSHTMNHPQLYGMSASEIEQEVSCSKKAIEDELGSAVESFAYPYAFPETDAGFKNRLRTTLEEAGYENGVCTVIGRAGSASDRFFLRRLPANSCDDRRLFQAKLEGAYDWLAGPQYLVKAAKGYLARRSS